MRRYAIMLKRRQRNTITLRQLFNEWLPINTAFVLLLSLPTFDIYLGVSEPSQKASIAPTINTFENRIGYVTVLFC